MSPRSRRMLSALLLFGVAVVLRFVLAGERGLWADELFSLAMATGHSLEHPAADADPAQGDFVEQREAQPPAAYARYLEHENPPAGARRVIRAVQLSDTSPPLYYLLLNLWTRRAGTSDLALRLFSVLWALAAFPLIWLLAERVGGPPAAFSSALLYTLAPPSLYYSVEGRMYAMLWFLAVAFIWLTLRLHDRGARTSNAARMDCDCRGRLSHPLLLCLRVGGGCALARPAPGADRAVLPSRWRARHDCAVSALVCASPRQPWPMASHRLLAKRATVGCSSAQRSDPSGLEPGCGPRNLGRLPLDRTASSPHLFVRPGLGGLAARRSAPLLAAPASCSGSGLFAACVGPLAFDLLRGTFASLMARYALAGLPAAMLLLGFALSRLPRRATNCDSWDSSSLPGCQASGQSFKTHGPGSLTYKSAASLSDRRAPRGPDHRALDPFGSARGRSVHDRQRSAGGVDRAAPTAGRYRRTSRLFFLATAA